MKCHFCLSNCGQLCQVCGNHLLRTAKVEASYTYLMKRELEKQLEKRVTQLEQCYSKTARQLKNEKSTHNCRFELLERIKTTKARIEAKKQKV